MKWNNTERLIVIRVKLLKHVSEDKNGGVEFKSGFILTTLWIFPLQHVTAFSLTCTISSAEVDFKNGSGKVIGSLSKVTIIIPISPSSQQCSLI